MWGVAPFVCCAAGGNSWKDWKFLTEYDLTSSKARAVLVELDVDNSTNMVQWLETNPKRILVCRVQANGVQPIIHTSTPSENMKLAIMHQKCDYLQSNEAMRLFQCGGHTLQDVFNSPVIGVLHWSSDVPYEPIAAPPMVASHSSHTAAFAGLTAGSTAPHLTTDASRDLIGECRTLFTAGDTRGLRTLAEKITARYAGIEPPAPVRPMSPSEVTTELEWFRKDRDLRLLAAQVTAGAL